MDARDSHPVSRKDSNRSVRGIETILALTDLSKHARLAVRRASRLASQHDAALRLVHVVPPAVLPPARAWLEARELRAQIADAKSALRALAAEATEHCAIQVGTQVLAGALLDEILRESDAADLLVLGARGLHPIRHALLGTTAKRLLTKCERPMLVVKQDAKPSYRRILVPVDLNDDADITLQAVLALAPDAEIHVLHAYEVAFEGKLRMAGVGQARIREYRQAARAKAQARLMAMVARQERGTLRFHRHLQRGHAGRVIRTLAARIDVDLIVMSKRSRSKLEDVLLGSVTEQAVTDARCDVLVLPMLPGDAAASR